MYPLSLTLKGFRGIRDGLGLDTLTLDLERLAGDAELVALAGPNGRGKSTILDNLQPFLTLPSRAALSGPGGFSYYDHVVLPESEKDLVWLHEGRRFRSQIVIRCNGRRATEAFLFEADAEGRWHPVRLPDGTVSDGKTSAYSRCVEHILGSAETFFVSAFSAQGKRQLSNYQNGEIKTLLSDLLGQEECRNQGKKAAQVVDLLKAGLVTLRQQQAALEDASSRLNGEYRRLGDPDAWAESRAQARRQAQDAQDATRARLAQCQAAFEQAKSVEIRRARMSAERGELILAGKQAIESIDAQQHGLRLQLERLGQRAAARKAQRLAQVQTLAHQRQQCEGALKEEPAILRAARRLALAEAVSARRSGQVRTAHSQAREFHRCEAGIEASSQRLRAIEREAGQAALRAQDLARRFGLTHEVPCAGSDLQGQCQLLGDARQARILMPSAQGTIQRLSSDKEAALQQLKALEIQRGALAGSLQELAWAERREAAARDRAGRYARLAARFGEARQARARLQDIEREQALAEAACKWDGEVDGGNDEERAERHGAEDALKSLQAHREQQAGHYRQRLDRLDADMADLPPAVDDRALDGARQAVALAQQAATQAEREHLQAVRDVETKAALMRQIQERRREQEMLAARLSHVQEQLGNWNLLVKCLGNDGLIALEIDDAGPAMTKLANDLLLACYGPRFTVSLLTQLENRKGEQREGFVIEVHDGESGQSKRVEQMSGGERVWINECLVRAVALYLAQGSGRCYGALFSDEVDGALDPSRKRMFMSMKREVLRLGGYDREIFISQTPELTAMADAVIDLDGFMAEGQPANAGNVGGSRG